jgi:hypothetical protein
LTVDTDGRIALNRVAKLRVEGGEASVNIILEQLAKGGPEIGSSGRLVKNKIENFRRDPCIDPLYDREIIFDPLGIIRTGI